MRVDLGIQAGESSKGFLVDLAKICTRLEKVAKILGKTDGEEDEERDEEEATPKRKVKGKTADDEDEDDSADESDDAEDSDDGADDADSDDVDDESEEDDSDGEDDGDSDDEDEEKPKKAAKAKKLTPKDCNLAAKERLAALIKRGKTGPESRKEIQKLMKKKFGVKSTQDLEPEQFAPFIKAMKAA